MLAIPETDLTLAPAPLGSVELAPARNRWLLNAAIAAAIAIVGICLRVWMPAGFHGVGFDEKLYRTYLVELDRLGLQEYDTVTQAYITDQRRPDSICKLPPTRFLYVYCGWLAKRAAFGDAAPIELKSHADAARDPALVSLHRVSRIFSILLLVLSGVAAWRMLGPRQSWIVLALMSAAPLQLHMAEHALIDGFFAFWAMLVLWALWENLRHPGHAGWLALYGAALACMVLTKENAFFVYAAAGGLLVGNRWLKFGTITGWLWLATGLGALAGAGILVEVAGGASSLFETYRLLVAKAEHLEYAALTGGGSWQRYLVDEAILSPWIVCLAIGGVCGAARRERGLLYCGGFIVLSYAIMCHVRNGMNLRYTTIWDMPLRMLAAAQLLDFAKIAKRWERPVLIAATVLVCGSELWQYRSFFISEALYEVPTESLLHAAGILK